MAESTELEIEQRLAEIEDLKQQKKDREILRSRVIALKQKRSFSPSQQNECNNIHEPGIQDDIHDGK